MKIKFIFFFVALSLSSIFANVASLEARNSVMEKLQKDIEKRRENKLEAKEIGEWYTIIEDAIFALFRRTEVFRGKLELIICKDDGVVATVYPNGTIIISSGLLEYIDESIFFSIADNVRKAKNINLYRELYLASFLSFEASRFALDVDALNWASNKNNTQEDVRGELKDDDVYKLDAFSAVLMKIAGYQDNLIEEHLERLKNSSGSSYFPKKIKNIDVRLKKLLAKKDGIEKTSEELASIIFQINTQQGAEDIMQSLELLQAYYPTSLYFLRLNVIASCSLYIEKCSPPSVIPLLPASIVGGAYDQKHYALLEKKIREVSFSYDENIKDASASNVLQSTLSLCKKYLDRIIEEPFLSYYIALTSMSEDKNLKKASIEQAQASLKDESLSIVEKINYAIALSNSPTHIKKSLDILKKLLKEREVQNNKNVLTNIYYFDERLIAYNYALILTKPQERNITELEYAMEVLKSKMYAKPSGDSLVIRKLKIEDTTDTLTKLWGEPSSIVYNYYFERWIYRHLKTMIVVSSYSTPPRVMEIIISPYSTVSLQGGIRAGDDKKALEAQFGSAVYRSGDAHVYFYGNEAIAVSYSSGDIIRSISIFRLLPHQEEWRK